MARGRPPRLVKQILRFVQDEMSGLKDGEALPPELELAQKYGVSRKTLRAAMHQLEMQHVISRVRGKGTFPTRGALARPIFRKQFGEIGAIVWGSGQYHFGILEGALQEALRCEWQIVLSGGPTAEERAEACWRLIDDHRIAGLLLLGLTDQRLLEELARRGKPICLVDHYAERAQVDCVRLDSASGSRIAVDHLCVLGHRRIAYIDFPERSTNIARYEGFMAGLAAHNIKPRPEWIVAAAAEDDVSKAALDLATLPAAQRPTAVVAATVETGLLAAQTIIRFGLRIPEDISLVSFSGPALPLTVNIPELTCVRFDTIQLGQAAVVCLLERIQKPGPCRNMVYPGTLRMGASTARIS